MFDLVLLVKYCNETSMERYGKFLLSSSYASVNGFTIHTVGATEELE